MWSITSDELEVHSSAGNAAAYYYYYAIIITLQTSANMETIMRRDAEMSLHPSCRGVWKGVTPPPRVREHANTHAVLVSSLWMLVSFQVRTRLSSASVPQLLSLSLPPPPVYVLMLPHKQQTDGVACLHGNKAHWMKWVNKCTNATFTSARVTTEGSYVPLFCSFDDTKSCKILKWQVWPISFHSLSIQNCIFPLRCVHFSFFTPLYVCRVWLAWC